MRCKRIIYDTRTKEARQCFNKAIRGDMVCANHARRVEHLKPEKYEQAVDKRLVDGKKIRQRLRAGFRMLKGGIGYDGRLEEMEYY